MSRLAEQTYSHCRNAFASAGEAKFFCSRCLDGDLFGRDIHDGSKGLAHLVDIWAKFGSLCANCDVSIEKIITFASDELNYMAEEYLAIDAFVAGIGVREMLSDVSKS